MLINLRRSCLRVLWLYISGSLRVFGFSPGPQIIKQYQFQILGLQMSWSLHFQFARYSGPCSGFQNCLDFLGEYMVSRSLVPHISRSLSTKIFLVFKMPLDGLPVSRWVSWSSRLSRFLGTLFVFLLFLIDSQSQFTRQVYFIFKFILLDKEYNLFFLIYIKNQRRQVPKSSGLPSLQISKCPEYP